MLIRRALGFNPAGMGATLQSMATMTVKGAGRKRWEGVGEEERKRLTAQASHAFWDHLSAEERSAEMRRRAMKRKQRGSE